MKNILLVIGSARKGRVADTVLSHVQAELSGRQDISATVVDLAELHLPFFENELAPSAPDYVTTDENVLAWGKTVSEADGVLFITPEYNHTLSAIQKNAIDSLFVEWNDKPVSAVAYGWSGGSLSVAALKELAPVIKIDLKEPIAQLAFMQDINPDGSIIEAEKVSKQIAQTIDALVA